MLKVHFSYLVYSSVISFVKLKWGKKQPENQKKRGDDVKYLGFIFPN